MKEEILKGGISFIEYIWHTEAGACEKCQELDGQTFTNPNEIPDKIHPNCKCWVEVIEHENGNESTNKGQDDEPCDCYDKMQQILDEADEMEGNILSGLDEIKNANEDIKTSIQEFKKYIDYYKQLSDEKINFSNYDFVFNYGYTALEIIESGINSYDIFNKNKKDMENTINAFDKYFHAKANCETVELGTIESMWAVIWSVGKEIYDIIKKVFIIKMKFDVALKDSYNDLKADFYGWEKGNQNGICSDKVNDVGKIFDKK